MKWNFTSTLRTIYLYVLIFQIKDLNSPICLHVSNRFHDFIMLITSRSVRISFISSLIHSSIHLLLASFCYCRPFFLWFSSSFPILFIFLLFSFHCTIFPLFLCQSSHCSTGAGCIWSCSFIDSRLNQSLFHVLSRLSLISHSKYSETSGQVTKNAFVWKKRRYKFMKWKWNVSARAIKAK